MVSFRPKPHFEVKIADFDLKLETPWHWPNEIPVVHASTISAKTNSERVTGVRVIGRSLNFEILETAILNFFGEETFFDEAEIRLP